MAVAAHAPKRPVPLHKQGVARCVDSPTRRGHGQHVTLHLHRREVIVRIPLAQFAIVVTTPGLQRGQRGRGTQECGLRDRGGHALLHDRLVAARVGELERCDAQRGARLAHQHHAILHPLIRRLTRGVVVHRPQRHRLSDRHLLVGRLLDDRSRANRGDRHHTITTAISRNGEAQRGVHDPGNIRAAATCAIALVDSATATAVAPATAATAIPVLGQAADCRAAFAATAPTPVAPAVC